MVSQGFQMLSEATAAEARLVYKRISRCVFLTKQSARPIVVESRQAFMQQNHISG